MQGWNQDFFHLSGRSETKGSYLQLKKDVKPTVDSKGKEDYSEVL